ncbi:hypothetical protein NDU88_004059 [Pleurodeles waltl]|uniref:Uncharacterized protein n=1 Tax=Pleurodeles waltl TaxID=8319 RepID=A0AAV7KZ85_PLEWA|nr:hypothetical protein NDU88_004059 [Pleurodeles waltl]
MCITPEAEGYVGWRKQEEKMPKETSSILDQNGRSDEEETKSEEERGTHSKELWREHEATEENRDTKPSAKDETKQENASTSHHVTGGAWLLQA